MTANLAIVIFLSVSVTLSIWKWLFRPTNPTLFIPEIRLDKLDLTKPEGVAVAIQIHATKYADVIYFDKLLWQIPAWVAGAVAAVILAAGASDDQGYVKNVLPGILIVYGIFSMLSGLFMFRLIRHRLQSLSAYRKLAEHLGDYSVRRPMSVDRWYWSMAVLFMTFIDSLGVASVTLGLWEMTQ